MVFLEQLDYRQQWLDEVEEIFKEGDQDGSGMLEVKEFISQFQDVRVQTRLQKLGLDVSCELAESLFMLLDFDGDGYIDINEFASSVQSIVGPAKSLDVARVNWDTRQIRKALS